MALKDCIIKEDSMASNLKHLLDIVDKLMEPSQGYSLGQIADTFSNLKVFSCVEIKSIIKILAPITRGVIMPYSSPYNSSNKSFCK